MTGLLLLIFIIWVIYKVINVYISNREEMQQTVTNIHAMKEHE
jgi:hypothetical protein